MNPFAHLRARIARSEEERGAILVLTALVMLLLLFIAAFATDLGAWYRQSEEQQRAADVGSLNGIATYDRVFKEALEAAPGDITTFQGLHAYDLANGTSLNAMAERDAVLAAVAQVRGLLETNGLTFTGDGIQNQSFETVVFDANGFVSNPNSVSTVTLVADDGTTIVITRSLVANGFDDSTPPRQLYTRAINVSITDEGEQYFSNILRDAPEIERAAQSLLENCGATCPNTVNFDPPFGGFDAPGNGDGYTPLLFDQDLDGKDDEVWAVNHHADPDRANPVGSIICYIAQGPDLGDECEGTAYSLDYHTSREPVEYIHDLAGDHHGKIYFAGSINNRSGIVCFDAETRNYCNTPFRDFWDITVEGQHPGFINVNGPFYNDGRLYTFAQNGDVACVNLDMSNCTIGGVQDLTYTNDALLPDLNPTTHPHRLLNGEQIGNNVLITQNTQTGVNITCLDLSSPNGAVSKCGPNTEHHENGLTGLARNFTFTRYNQAGGVAGVCVWNFNTANHVCVNQTAQSPTTLTGLDNLPNFTGGFKGDAFTWNNERTFFGGGSTDYVLCYNWAANNTGGAPCTDGPDLGGSALLADTNFLEDELGIDVTAGREDQGIETYAFAAITDDCVIALGDEAIFFSFNPIGFGPCVGTQTTTAISPCTCTDENAGTRWGALQVPEGLLADSISITATISLTDGGVAIGGFDAIDLKDPAVDGFIDLTPLNTVAGNPDLVYLTLDVVSDVDGSGMPLFAQPYEADLEVSISPTLSE